MRCLVYLRFALPALALGACASPGVPPGGPEDIDPPAVVASRPDTNAVNVRPGGLTLDFDDVISERPQGATRLADLFLISPSNGVVELSWRRTRLIVRPEGGFRPNTTYRVQMLPGLTDLDQNIDSIGRTIVFSTGPEIARGVVTGRVFEWLEERPAKQAWVEALVLPDSLRYLAVTDSLGTYALRNLPPGKYVLRTLVDGNKNRRLDPRELFDTASVTLADSMAYVLHAINRDTIGPGIDRVEFADSLNLRVRLDRALDTAFAIGATTFTLVDKDSAAVRIVRAIGGRVARREAADSARAKAVQDSIRQASDSTRRDSTRAPARAAAPPRPTTTQQALARAIAGRGREEPRDTTPPPRPTVAIPELEVILRLERPLAPQSNYLLRATDLRSVVGVSRSSQRRFQTPRAQRRDSTQARPTPRDTGTTRRDTSRTRS